MPGARQTRAEFQESTTPLPASGRREGQAVALECDRGATVTGDSSAAEVMLSAAGTFVRRHQSESEARTERNRQLAIAIRQRIESRLRGRIRNLVVHVIDGIVALEGQCSTYYTKQLAQHAALGILEDEHLENAIVVEVPR